VHDVGSYHLHIHKVTPISAETTSMSLSYTYTQFHANAIRSPYATYLLLCIYFGVDSAHKREVGLTRTHSAHYISTSWENC
jgi:hypothetical protein